MDIKILNLIEGAKQSKGLVVVIDVFRAFSTACYLFDNGARRVIPVGNIELAYKLKKDNPDFVLIGERNGIKPNGFDYGNSPTEIENIDFTDKTIIQTTSAGTQGIANAINADDIITGSFVNVNAIIDYIKMKNPKNVSLIAMGTNGTEISDEDVLCAEYIKNSLENKPNDFPSIVSHLKNYKSADKFFDNTKNWAPEQDFELCMSLNKFDFILKLEKDKSTSKNNNHNFLKKVKI